MINVGIVGSTGYGGCELVRFLFLELIVIKNIVMFIRVFHFIRSKMCR